MNKCIYNGNIVANRNLVSVYNGSFLYGINCFEGLRGYWLKDSKRLIILDLDEHMNRLYSSASRMRLIPPISKDDLVSKLNEFIRYENITEHIYVRITFFIDGETSWIECKNVSYLVSMRSMQSRIETNKLLWNYSLKISTTLRNTELSSAPSIKAGGNYLNSRYAKLEAKENGYDDAVFLNHDGFISESTGSCIFFILNGKVLTPSRDCDILPSITRRRILILCQENNIEAIEGEFTADYLMRSEGIFLSGSMMEIQPVSQIENIRIDTKNSQVFLRILNLFHESLKRENI